MRCKFIAMSVQRGGNEGRIKEPEFGAGGGVTRDGVCCSRAASEHTWVTLQHHPGFGQVNSQTKDAAKSPQAVCENTFAVLGLEPGVAGPSEVVDPPGCSTGMAPRQFQKGNEQFQPHTKLKDAERPTATGKSREWNKKNPFSGDEGLTCAPWRIFLIVGILSTALFLYFFAVSGQQRPLQFCNLSRVCLQWSRPRICRWLNAGESGNEERVEFSNREFHQHNVLTRGRLGLCGIWRWRQVSIQSNLKKYWCGDGSVWSILS